jgi:hypothetical protein
VTLSSLGVPVRSPCARRGRGVRTMAGANRSSQKREGVVSAADAVKLTIPLGS